MKAVHFGAGNIGRGFIGQLLHQNGFEICFVDTNADLISQLNEDGGYRIDIMDEQETTVFVDRISALNSLTETEKVIAAIKEADILTTSVGANNLVKIAPTIAKGLSERFKQKRSINILANENAINASNILKEAVYKTLLNKRKPFMITMLILLIQRLIGNHLVKLLRAKLWQLLNPIMNG